MTLHISERKRTADFLAFLRLLLRRYAGRHVFRFLDNCAIHNSRAALRFLADQRDPVTPTWNAP